MSRITLLDYGMCNMLNVARAFQHVGADLHITEDPAEVQKADRLVVPGVGAFQDSMAELTSRGFGDAIRRFVDTGRPMLGICVGMQVLFEGSDEFGEHAGLGILPGRVVAVPNRSVDGEPMRVPHIGWNHLVAPETGRDWAGSLLEPLKGQGPAVYFVHSFAAQPVDASLRLADCVYGGHRLCAVVQQGAVMATQFHPERSGETGLKVLRHFQSI
jgi:glutamine amidotransferase